MYRIDLRKLSVPSRYSAVMRGLAEGTANPGLKMLPGSVFPGRLKDRYCRNPSQLQVEVHPVTQYGGGHPMFPYLRA